MENQENNNGEPNQEREDIPTLDIIKIDGRWAQAYSSGGDLISIGYLDNGKRESIDLKDFELTQKYDVSVDLLDGVYHEGITEDEIKNIYYDFETTKLPKTTQRIPQGWVHVFGEYKKR